jgi:hypothetical protein
MMFSERSAPSRAAAELRQVRCSLNTPVVSIEKLPVGPATAAIALHDTSGDGSPYFTVAVRCERTRAVVFFAVNDEVDSVPRTLAGDAALFLAESMGFLFDDWVVAGNPATREAANRLWGEFVEAAESRPVELSPPNSQGRAPTEIRADDTTPAIQLTKFRGALPWSTRESAEAATPPRDSTRPAGWLAGLFSQLARPRGG